MRAFLFILAFTFVAGAAHAQQPVLTSLTLEEALARAATHNPTVQQRLHAVAAAGYREQEQRIGYLPVLTLTTAFARADAPQKFPIPDEHGEIRIVENGTANSMQMKLEATYALYDFGKTRHAVEAARYEQGALQAGGNRQAIDIAEQVKAQFYRAGFFAQLDSLYGTNMAFGEQLEGISREQVASGAALPLEVLRAQVDLQQIRSQRAAAHAEAEKALDALAALMGQETRNFTVLLDLPGLPVGLDPALLYEALYRQALASRQDLKQLDFQQQQQHALVRAAHAQARPTIALTASGAYLGPKEVFGVDAPGIRPYSLKVGVGLSFNLINLRAAQIKQQELEAIGSQIQEQERSLRLQIGTEIKHLLADVQSQQVLLESSRILFEEAKANLRLVEIGYRNGSVALLDLTHAQATATNAEVALAQARYTIAQLLLELERTVGAEIRFVVQ